MLYKRKLIDLLLHEGIIKTRSEYFGIESSFESIPVQKAEQIHGVWSQDPDGSLDWIAQRAFENWPGYGYNRGRNPAYAQEGTHGAVFELLQDLNEWFSQNPQAKMKTQKSLQGLKPHYKATVVETAVPIWPDDSADTELSDKNVPLFWVAYNKTDKMWKLVPNAYLKDLKGFFAWVIERGQKAEEDFAALLRAKGLLDAKRVGGSANPDVKAGDMKFEVGTGDKKQLHLGSMNRTSKYPHIQKRIQLLDTMNLDKSGYLNRAQTYEIWKNASYDFLVRGTGGEHGFQIFAIDPSKNKIGDTVINVLSLETVLATRIRKESEGLSIPYGSIDWSKSTIIK